MSENYVRFVDASPQPVSSRIQGSGYKTAMTVILVLEYVNWALNLAGSVISIVRGTLGFAVIISFAFLAVKIFILVRVHNSLNLGRTDCFVGYMVIKVLEAILYAVGLVLFSYLASAEDQKMYDNDVVSNLLIGFSVYCGVCVLITIVFIVVAAKCREFLAEKQRREVHTTMVAAMPIGPSPNAVLSVSGTAPAAPPPPYAEAKMDKF